VSTRRHGREGYDPEFLGSDDLAVPLLGLGKHEHHAADPVEPMATDGKFLHYTHFSVAFSSTRRIPIFTAVNIDGENLKKIKRKDDKWFADLRLPGDIQLNQKDYAHPDTTAGTWCAGRIRIGELSNWRRSPTTTHSTTPTPRPSIPS
jgi:endonuclease G, mitochondrial